MLKAVCIGVVWWWCLATVELQAQSRSDSVWVTKINAIHGDPESDPGKKITAFKQLQAEIVQYNLPKSASYALLVHRLGDAFAKAGDPGKAVYYTKEAIQINASGRPGTDRSFLVNSYFNLGIFYKTLHLHQEAHHYFSRCITLGVQYIEKHFIAHMAFEQQAYLYYQTGDYQQSVKVADEGLQFAVITGNQHARAALLAQRAQSRGELMRYGEAEADVNMAIALLEKSADDPTHLATCYSVYASILSKSNRSQMSIRYYQKAFDLNRANGNLEQSARDLQDMGCVYADELKQPDQAIACYHRGIKLARDVGDVYQLSALYANIGIAYAKTENYNRALHYYQKALTTLPVNFRNLSLKANPDPQQLKLVANDYFMVTILSGKGSALLERYKQSKDLTDLKLALTTFELADQSIDFMRWKQSGTESKLIWRKNTREMYERCMEVCFQLKALDKAYYFIEKSRAVLLNDQLNQTIADAALPESAIKKEKQLRVNAGILSEQLLNSSASKLGYARLREKWLEAQEKWENYIKALEHQYPVYYRYKCDPAVFPYTDVKRKMSRDNSSFISYFKGKNVVYALMVSGSKQKLLKIHYPAYEHDSRTVMALCADPGLLNQNFPAYKRLAFNLYRKVFKELSVSTSRVIVSQDGPFVSFEALVSDTGSNYAFLAKQYAFSYVPTFRMLTKRSLKNESTGDFLGIAPVNYAPASNLPSLKGSDKSIHTIASTFKDAQIWSGDAASKAAFVENAHQYQLIQLYAHADAQTDDDLNSEKRPKEPVLYLANDSIKLSEIYQLRFNNTQLLALSACNTGIGRQASGEGIFSLARGFMAAGVPASITSLWRVDDLTTYQLMESFYAHLQEGLPKDVALNAAKLDLIGDENQMRTLPYYWAAAILVGDASSLRSSDGPAIHFWIAGPLMVVFLALFFWFKRKK